MMISTKKLRISMMKWIYTILIKKKACRQTRKPAEEGSVAGDKTKSWRLLRFRNSLCAT